MDSRTKREIKKLHNYLKRSIFPDTTGRMPRAYRFGKITKIFFIPKYPKKTEKLKSINLQLNVNESDISTLPTVNCRLKKTSLYLKQLTSLILYTIKCPEYAPVTAKKPKSADTTSIYTAPNLYQALFWAVDGQSPTALGAYI